MQQPNATTEIYSIIHVINSFNNFEWTAPMHEKLIMISWQQQQNKISFFECSWFSFHVVILTCSGRRFTKLISSQFTRIFQLLRQIQNILVCSSYLRKLFFLSPQFSKNCHGTTYRPTV